MVAGSADNVLKPLVLGRGVDDVAVRGDGSVDVPEAGLQDLPETVAELEDLVADVDPLRGQPCPRRR